MRKRAAAFTLSEIMIAMTIFSVTTSLGFQLLNPCLAIFNLDQNQARLDETTLVLNRRVNAELEASTIDSVTVNLNAVSFLTGSSYDPTSGRPIWQQFVVYYLDNGSLWRKNWLPAGLPSTKTLRLSSIDLATAVATPNGSESLMAQNVQSFTPALTSSVQLLASLQSVGATSSMNTTVQPKR